MKKKKETRAYPLTDSVASCSLIVSAVHQQVHRTQNVQPANGRIGDREYYATVPQRDLPVAWIHQTSHTNPSWMQVKPLVFLYDPTTCLRDVLRWVSSHAAVEPIHLQ